MPAPIPPSTLDLVLTAQFAVAWAGEGGESRRLAWWRTDMVSEFGGADLFKRLAPSSWRWAVLQAARAAAQRVDRVERGRLDDADKALTLFFQGFELDERIEERLQELKRLHAEPERALPGLGEVVGEEWDREKFAGWVRAHGVALPPDSPVGRLIKGAAPAGLELRFQKLISALDPLGPEYPLPYFRRSA
jgi:hypothetical protein